MVAAANVRALCGLTLAYLASLSRPPLSLSFFLGEATLSPSHALPVVLFTQRGFTANLDLAALSLSRSSECVRDSVRYMDRRAHTHTLVSRLSHATFVSASHSIAQHHTAIAEYHARSHATQAAESGRSAALEELRKERERVETHTHTLEQLRKANEALAAQVPPPSPLPSLPTGPRRAGALPPPPPLSPHRRSPRRFALGCAGGGGLGRGGGSLSWFASRWQ
jgi:hypothetical protein